ncbi:hypothetical protein [Pseudokineococcus sp. 1T1Z-3]|uniref:hypothetical protein n=1 Tax=Pseudokineococcus sp. 1T1Z-3 TaxID=3132745 RepID=UPI0030A9BCAF
MASTPLSRLAWRAHEDDDATGRSPWRRPGFVVSAVVLALFALLAVVLFVLPPSDEGAAAPQPSPSPSPSIPAEPEEDAEPVAGESVCGLSPGSPGVPVEAPAAEWQLVGTTAVPTDPEGAGPGTITDDGFASCFSHDPTGALFASINWWAQSFNGRSRQVYEELTAMTPERDAALAGDISESAQGVGQIAGYRFVRADEDQVLVELAVRTPDGAYASLPTPMRWEDGDWKYVIPSNFDPGVSALPNLTGFTPWSGIA